jgi:hypothetical protein
MWSVFWEVSTECLISKYYLINAGNRQQQYLISTLAKARLKLGGCQAYDQSIV